MNDKAHLERSEIASIMERAHLLIGKEELDAAIAKVGEQLTQDLADEQPLMLCVMNGGLIFMGNLLLHCHFPLQYDYLRATRYRGEQAGGQLSWLVKPSISLKGRTVVIVDDILDEGVTLEAICEYCEQQGAKKVLTVVLVDKLKERPANGVQKADYAALEVEDYFILGYGMDYQEYFRNLPGIYALSPNNESEDS